MFRILLCSVLCFSQAISAQSATFYFQANLNKVQFESLFDTLGSSKTIEQFFKKLHISSKITNRLPSYKVHKHASLKHLKIKKINPSKFILKNKNSKPLVFEKYGTTLFLNGVQVFKKDLASEKSFCTKFKICDLNRKQSFLQFILLSEAKAAAVTFALLAIAGFGLLVTAIATGTHPLARGMAAYTETECIIPVKGLIKSLDGKYRTLATYKSAFNAGKRKLKPERCQEATISETKITTGFKKIRKRPRKHGNR